MVCPEKLCGGSPAASRGGTTARASRARGWSAAGTPAPSSSRARCMRGTSPGWSTSSWMSSTTPSTATPASLSFRGSCPTSLDLDISTTSDQLNNL
ncbi:hypothetical protein PVAP13_9KG131500 [Panicum virgatum]|uniref:Uncharacterized protein n=1 Tax=Panicum virgatum TaxID=38727 RepID=A0A8T0NF46_PANVG|nr:hypothetical protein PVAP13_9KG131500 [Panicum virgatum]